MCERFMAEFKMQFRLILHSPTRGVHRGVGERNNLPIFGFIKYFILPYALGCSLSQPEKCWGRVPLGLNCDGADWNCGGDGGGSRALPRE